MTLLNHIGIYLLLLIICYIVVIFKNDFNKYSIKDKIMLTPVATLFFFGIFEAFYWTFKIFF